MSCLNYAVWEDLPPPNVSDILKSLSLLLLGLSVMTCNLLWILVLKSKRFRDTSVSDQVSTECPRLIGFFQTHLSQPTHVIIP